MLGWPKGSSITWYRKYLNKPFDQPNIYLHFICINIHNEYRYIMYAIYYTFARYVYNESLCIFKCINTHTL